MAFLGGCYFAAALHGDAVEQHLSDWQDGESRPQPAAWQEAWRQIGIARLLNPLNPDYIESRARLRQVWLANNSVAPEYRTELLAQIVSDYRLVVKWRPTWPYAWSNLAVAKAAADEYDSELFKAISRAVSLGPWEPRVQLQMARLGMRYDQQLNGETRRIISDNIQRGLGREYRRLFVAAQEFGRLHEMCDNYRLNQGATDECKRLGWNEISGTQIEDSGTE